MSFQALWKFSLIGCCSVIPGNPSPSSCLARSKGKPNSLRSVTVSH